MEYFVDEMPRDCASCKHYHMNCADGYSCSKLRKEIHPNFSDGIGYRHQDCPLQSLTNYIKQVRKKEREKIKNLNHQLKSQLAEIIEKIGGEIYTRMVVECKETKYTDINLILNTILKEYQKQNEKK